MSHFLNAREALVGEAIDGMLSGSDLVRLDGYPSIRVVHRPDLDPARVALISGGGSGHEPAHAGFVGEGMLTAAVCGEVFASPSVDAVLAAILAVTGEAGCLLVIKNYTGDRLNFGLAAERARLLGKRVETVFVADDVALPDAAQPRGVAGTLFVHKIAGHLAERGEPLERVADVAREVAAQARSYGVALDNCTVPGVAKDARVPEGRMELGLGIHGEPGVETVPREPTDALVERVARALFAPLDDDERAVVLLNDLGSTTPLEMQSIAGALLGGRFGARVAGLVGPAPLMTSLDMHGFSLSLLPARDDWLEALASAVGPRAWPRLATPSEVSVAPLPEGMGGRRAAPPSEDAATRALVEDSCAAFAAMESDLNALDAKTGDGDTGSTLAQAARAIGKDIDALPLASTAELLLALGERLATAMGGSSGVLLAILFEAAGEAAESGAGASEALRAGLDRMMEVGGAGPGHRTMVDALLPALDALAKGGSLADAARAARAGADATATMGRALSGRSTHVPESALAGVADPGAEGVARYFEMLVAR